MPPITPGCRVIAELGDRLVCGEVVATEPAPRFGALGRTRLSLRTEPHGTEVTVLARDVKATDTDADGPGPSAPLMDVQS